MASWGRCDYKQMQKLAESMRQFEKLDRQNLCESLAKEIAARLLRLVIKRTPVDTGTLKGSWREENNHLIVVKHGNTYEVTITNSMEYASYVEFGHRTANHTGYVPGKYMLTISEQAIQKLAPKIIEKRIMEQLMEVF